MTFIVTIIVFKGEIYEYLGEQRDLDHFALDSVVQIASWQPEVNFIIDHEDGKHVGIISYFTELDKPIEGTTMFVTLKDDTGNGKCIAATNDQKGLEKRLKAN